MLPLPAPAPASMARVAADSSLPIHRSHCLQSHHSVVAPPPPPPPPRYGKFGYAFGRGSYNISREQYAAAVARVGGAALTAIAADFSWLAGEPMERLLQQYTSRGKGQGKHGGPGVTVQQALSLPPPPHATCATCAHDMCAFLLPYSFAC